MQNLQALDITSVVAIGSIRLDDADGKFLTEKLKLHQDNWPRRSLTRLGFREVDEVRHHVELEIEVQRSTDPQSARLTLAVHTFPRSERLRASTRRRQEDEMDDISNILSDFRGVQLQSLLHAHINWRFPPDSRRPIINLPMMTTQDPNLPFSEISGIRMKKRDKGLTTVTIDLMENRTLSVVLMFPLTGLEITESLLDEAISLGSKIIADYLTVTENSTKGQE